MNKIILLFLIILLISDTYTSSDCLDKKTSSSRRRLSSLLTEEDCSSLSVSATNLMCILSSDQKSCDEVSICKEHIEQIQID